mmetsp:Transcript_20230/g.17435  ORF Transcript_20230/g.17435 Transcript_20230/m.17435 type:complete len:178 (-) Transcript_20230:2264-2797(-)
MNEMSGLSIPRVDMRPLKSLRKLQSGDYERVGSFQDETADRSYKKQVSFFQFSNRSNNAFQSHIEYNNAQFGEEWKLKKVRLDLLIKKAPMKFTWEGHNTALKKKCLLKLQILDYEKMSHSNFRKAETILKELASIQHPNIRKIYSFSIWNTDVSTRRYHIISIIGELARCSLENIH